MTGVRSPDRRSVRGRGRGVRIRTPPRPVGRPGIRGIGRPGRHADVWARMHAELERQRRARPHPGRFGRLTAEATSPTGDVAVTVNARGLLVGLTIALRTPGPRRDHPGRVDHPLVAAADEKLRATRDQVSMSIVDGPEVTSPGYDDIVDVVRG